MKKIFLTALIGSLFTTVFAQTQDFTKKSDSDPAATAVLDKMKTKYDSYKTLEADFEIVIEIPEQQKEIQNGKLQQQGEKYRVTLEGQIIVSDGETLWYYSERRKEVQINDVEESEGEVMSPKDLMRIYESEEYVYFLTNEMAENGRVIQQIEFKPLDSDSEYSKLRLTLDKKSQEIMRIKTFAKDGSRYTFLLKKIVPNKAFENSLFQFQKSECPDCHFEDLRI